MEWSAQPAGTILMSSDDYRTEHDELMALRATLADIKTFANAHRFVDTTGTGVKRDMDRIRERIEQHEARKVR